MPAFSWTMASVGAFQNDEIGTQEGNFRSLTGKF
jgi:hypothetical protein